MQLGPEVTIGRAYSNILRLEGEDISRVHAIIFRRGEDFILRDLDSKNGVYVNGTKVPTAVLAQGDEILIGKYAMLFDPKPQADISGFLKKYRVRPGDSSARYHTTNTANLFEGLEKEGEAVAARAPTSLAQIFFSPQEVDELCDPFQGSNRDAFLTELVSFHRQLTGPVVAEDMDDEGLALQHLLRAVVSTVSADRGVIVLKDETNEVLRLGGLFPKDRDISVNRVVLKAVLRETEAVLCNDVQADPRFRKTDTIAKENIGSLIAYPLIQGGQAFGLIYCDVQGRTEAFHRPQLLLLKFVASIAQLTMRRMEARR